MLKLQHLTKRFGTAPLFTDLCMEVDAPVVLWAPSGWGKTTLLRILMGLERPTTGSVEGVGRVAAVFQEDRLCPQLNAVQNVTLVLPGTENQYKEQIISDFQQLGMELAASTTLTTAPSTKPSKMRPELKPTRCQKSALGSSCTNVRSACTGDTKNTSCPMAIAAACQTASQNATASKRRKNCLFCFINCPLPLPIIRYSIPYRPAKGNDLCTTCGGSAQTIYTFIQLSYA